MTCLWNNPTVCTRFTGKKDDYVAHMQTFHSTLIKSVSFLCILTGNSWAQLLKREPQIVRDSLKFIQGINADFPNTELFVFPSIAGRFSNSSWLSYGAGGHGPTDHQCHYPAWVTVQFRVLLDSLKIVWKEPKTNKRNAVAKKLPTYVSCMCIRCSFSIMQVICSRLE